MDFEKVGRKDVHWAVQRVAYLVESLGVRKVAPKAD
jgi:hypothetical protein